MMYAIGISLWFVVLYLAAYEVFHKRWMIRVDQAAHRIQAIAHDNDRTIRGAMWTDASHREHSMILMGTLFIPTAFILLGAAIQTDVRLQSARAILVIAAPLLYSFWLFFVQLSTRVMMDSEFRMMQISGGTTSYIAATKQQFYGDKHGRGLLMKLRRNHWLSYLVILWFIAMWITGFSAYILVVLVAISSLILTFLIKDRQ